jgi:hypothetical protein
MQKVMLCQVVLCDVPCANCTSRQLILHRRPHGFLPGLDWLPGL